MFGVHNGLTVLSHNDYILFYLLIITLSFFLQFWLTFSLIMNLVVTLINSIEAKVLQHHLSFVG